MKITVCIPSIAPRTDELSAALRSVSTQDQPADAVAIAFDTERVGAPRNRDAALAMVTTELVAFLDDDDILYPQHLRVLHDELERTGADLVYPWFDVQGGTDPFPMFFGKAWDNASPHQVPITYLARTEVIRAVGGFAYDWDEATVGKDEYGNRAGEDYRLMERMAQRDFNIVHLPQRTWMWRHHHHNTSGRPGQW